MKVENLNLIENLEGATLEIDINVGGIEITQFIDEVHIETDDKEIIIEDFANELILPIHIKTEQTISVEENLNNTIELYMLHGQVNFIEM